MEKCRVEKRIYHDVEKQSEYTSLFYELDVDRKPERGEELSDGRWYSGRLNFVVWNVEQDRFDCRVEDEVPRADESYDYPHDFLVANAVHEGWSVSADPVLERP